MTMNTLRPDLKVIAALIAPSSLVLEYPAQKKQAIGRGLSVIHGGGDENLTYYPDKAYDYVISSQTLQAMKHPKVLML